MPTETTDMQPYTLGILQVHLPEEPEQTIQNRPITNDVPEDDILFGIEGVENLYHAQSEDGTLHVYVHVLSIEEESSRSVIAAIIEGDYKDEEERISMSAANVDWFFRDAGVESLFADFEDVTTDSGGREINRQINGETVTVQESYAETSDGQKIVSRGIYSDYILANVFVVSSSSESYAQGMEILDSMTALPR